MLDVHPDALHRSHSASSVEELLSSPPSHYQLAAGGTPTRSSSFDSVSNVSGTSTPTARSMVDAESAVPFPLVH